MCGAIEAAEQRMNAARRLSLQLQAAATAPVLAAALPLHSGIPYEMAGLLAQLDEKEQA